MKKEEVDANLYGKFMLQENNYYSAARLLHLSLFSINIHNTLILSSVTHRVEAKLLMKNNI